MTPVLQSLIDRHDSAVAAVLADPRVASDRSNPLIRDYLQLFVPQASFPSSVIQSWEREAEQGRFYRPGPAGVMRRSTVMSVSGTSDDDVSFTVCIRNSVEITDAAGTVLEAQGGVSGGQINATRVDGVWLLRDLSQSSVVECPSPREGT